MINLKVLYTEYFYISPLDLADLAEKNRIRTYYLSWLALIGSFVSIPFVFYMYRNSLREKLATLIFWGVCVFINVLSVILCYLLKEPHRY